MYMHIYMEAVTGKEKKNLLIRTWERCKSISVGGGGGGGGGGGRGGENINNSPSKPSRNFSKSKSWHCLTKSFKEDKKKKTKSATATTPHHHHQHRVAPEGCFSVYVGPERQRFVIKTEYASHPLFKMLLEDAELEYGYSSEGPLLIPCEVGLFHRVLAEMDHSKEITPNCGFAYASCSPFHPSLRMGGGNKVATKGYGSYGLLTPPRLLKLNQF